MSTTPTTTNTPTTTVVIVNTNDAQQVYAEYANDVEQHVDTALFASGDPWHETDVMLKQEHNSRSLEVGGDGNCMFLSCAYQLNHVQNTDSHTHGQVRARVVTELHANKDFYKGFLPRQQSSNDTDPVWQSFEEYVHKMSQDGEWGDHMVLQAVANAYNVLVLVVKLGQDQPVRCTPRHASDEQLSERPKLWVVHLQDHYRAMVPLDGHTLTMPVNCRTWEQFQIDESLSSLVWADTEQRRAQDVATHKLIQLLKHLHDDLRKQSLTGSKALNDITQFFGAFLLSRDETFRARVREFMERPDTREGVRRSATQFLAFHELDHTNEGDIVSMWKFIVNRVLCKLEPDIYTDNNSLNCRDNITLQKMLERMRNTFATDTTVTNQMGDFLGVMYEHFSNSYMSEGKNFGQYFTPYRLVQVIVKLLPVEALGTSPSSPLSVYDPSMGTAGFLSCFFSCHQQHHGTAIDPATDPNASEVHFYGRELERTTYALARMALRLTGLSTQRQHVQFGDTLLQPPSSQQHDLILSNPPFAIKTKKNERRQAYENHRLQTSDDVSTIAEARAEFVSMYPFECTQDITLGMFVTHCVKKTKQGGYGAVVVPVGTRLCSGKEKGALALRQWLVDEVDVYQILCVPRGVFPNAGVATVVLYYRKKGKTTSVRFLEVNAELNRVHERLVVSRAELDANLCQLEMSVYAPEEDLSLVYAVPIVALGDVVEFRNGRNITKKELQNGDVPVIGGGKSPMGTHNVSNEPAGALVMSKIGAAAGFVKFYTVRVFVTSNALVLSSRNTNVVLLRYVAYFLEGSQARLYKLQEGCAQPLVRVEELKAFKIPLPPLHIQQQIIADLNPIDALRTQLATVNATHERRKMRLLWSWLRLHAEECEQVALGDVCTIEYGTRIVRKNTPSGEYPVYGGGGETFTTQDFNRQGTSIVISRFGVSPHCVRILRIPFFLNDSGMTIEPSDTRLDNDFLLHILQAMQDRVYQCASGAAQANLNMVKFKSLKIPLPPLHLQQQWAAELQTIDQAIHTNTQILNNLDHERDTILRAYLHVPTTTLTPATPEPTTPATPPPVQHTPTISPPTAALLQAVTQADAPPIPHAVQAHLNRHTQLVPLVDWAARTLHGVPFADLPARMDFRQHDGRTFWHSVKDVLGDAQVSAAVFKRLMSLLASNGV